MNNTVSLSLIELTPVYFFAVTLIVLLGVILIIFGRLNLMEQLFDLNTTKRSRSAYRLRENVSFVAPESSVKRSRQNNNETNERFQRSVPVTLVEYLRVTPTYYDNDYNNDDDDDDDNNNENNAYGAQTVNIARTMRLGYRRSLKRFRREEITIDTTNDTKCDDWMSVDDQATLNKRLRLCNVSEGSRACFRCVESRRFVRECIHLSKPVTVTNSNNVTLSIPANDTSDYGWCLPSEFRNISFVDDKPIPVNQGTLRNCNPNTGDWLLVRADAYRNVKENAARDNNVNSLDPSYNWICRCRYPALMTNLYDLSSDCARPVGCQPGGELDEQSRTGKIDPYANGRCVCDARHKASFEPTIGPVCQGKTIVDYGLANLNDESIVDYLPISAISREMLSLLTDVDANNIKLPNPCHVDAFWKRKLTDNECRLVEYNDTAGNRMAFCVSSSENYVAFRRTSDYLLNNHGKYPNACVYVGARDILDEDKRKFRPTNHREYVDNLFVLSHYNQRVLPDVGLLVYRDDARIQRLKDSITGDRGFIEWYKANCRDIDPNEHIPMRFAMSTFFLNRPLVVYNEFPDISSVRVTDVTMFFVLYDRAVNPSEKLQKLMIVSDEKGRKHIRPFERYGNLLTNVYLYLNAKDYNTYFSPTGNNCYGYGVVEEEQPVFLDYFDQTAEPKQMRKYGVQWFLRSTVDAIRYYPALSSRDFCGKGCGHGEPAGTLEDAYEKEYPKLWPVVTHGNRKIAPNSLHMHFDATVQIVITNNFYVVMTNGYSADFLDYKQSKNRTLFELRPKKFDDLV